MPKPAPKPRKPYARITLVVRDRITHYRARGYTQARIARMVGVSTSAVCKFLARNPAVASLRKPGMRAPKTVIREHGREVTPRVQVPPKMNLEFVINGKAPMPPVQAPLPVLNRAGLSPSIQEMLNVVDALHFTLHHYARLSGVTSSNNSPIAEQVGLSRARKAKDARALYVALHATLP